MCIGQKRSAVDAENTKEDDGAKRQAHINALIRISGKEAVSLLTSRANANYVEATQFQELTLLDRS